MSNHQVSHPQKDICVALVFEDSVLFHETDSCQWAIDELETCLLERMVNFNTQGQCTCDHRNTTIVHLVSMNCKSVETVKNLIHVDLPTVAESFVITQKRSDNRQDIYLFASDARGIVYAITELVDRARYAPDISNLFDIDDPVIEIPTAKIRSISKCFESIDEDLDWYHDREEWCQYLSLLASQRFNRIALTFGMTYNYPYDNEFISDVYFHLAYPFLVSTPGYDVEAVGVTKEEREKNLETLKFIAQEAKRRGLDFQLALWTQNYDFDDSPNANYPIIGITDENRANYCRDSLSEILRAVSHISGLTLRVHVECGIPEGSYKFWSTYFEAVKNCGREIELDLHAKGIDEQLIEIALSTGMPVNISPKYTSEHMGLPYHQTSIRNFEIPSEEDVDAKWINSEGSRKFLRYSYGDLLREDRQYGVLYRIWPGTQRVLLWGDPALAGGYGRSSVMCGTLGVELCEPLSFKGRMGTGIKGGRNNYQDASLTSNYDWQKYDYMYRVWGRSLFTPFAATHACQRYLQAHFGEAGEICGAALANASRILPFITLAHTPSACNNTYWPEIYENMSVVHEAPDMPYSYDMDKPSRFGTVGSCDPQLFFSPYQLARILMDGEKINKISPLSCADWLDKFATTAFEGIARARDITTKETREFRRLAIDTVIQAAIGRFFAGKIRCAVLWEFFRLSGEQEAAREAINHYKKARDAWMIAAEECKDTYLPDLTYGPQPWLRGRWDDRLPAIEKDISDMESVASQDTIKRTIDCKAGKSIVARILAWSTPQRDDCHHVPPIGFLRGTDIDLSCRLANGSRNTVHLYYRRVDQSECWQSLVLDWHDGCYSGCITGGYTDTSYPLQYYFEIDKGSYSVLCPGLTEDLSNEPYFTIRQIFEGTK